MGTCSTHDPLHAALPSRSVWLVQGQWHTPPVAADTILFIMSKPFQRGTTMILEISLKKVSQECWKVTDAFQENSSLAYTILISMQSLSQTLSLFSK